MLWLPGSSPRGRGGLRQLVDATPFGGLIPARAGRTPKARTATRCAGAHPRAGGADASHPIRPSRFRGSSPRGRGGHRRSSVPHSGERAHPRAGGADAKFLPKITPALGSSPRGRGGHGRVPRRVSGRGLIPARAGRTPHSRGPPRCGWAHPRAGGADAGWFGRMRGAWGSSPRGRGGRPDVRGAADHPGLIPARAGRTQRRSVIADARRAHPRAGGADGAVLPRDGSQRGSSPRGRGGRGEACPHAGVRGLIPARAGRTAGSCRACGAQGAHPRAGGADASSCHALDLTMGSSPRGRGGQPERIPEYRAEGALGRRINCTPSKSTGSQSCR